ncbi:MULTISPECIES: hypothetical protein [Streptomyces]
MTKPGTYSVQLRFREGGPAVTGWWTDKEVARSKYKAEIGRRGSRPGVVITLSVQAEADQEVVLRTWTAGVGETLGPQPVPVEHADVRRPDPSPAPHQPADPPAEQEDGL